MLEEVYWAYVKQVEQTIRFGFAIAHKEQRIGGARADQIADLVQEIFARAFAERARLAFDGIREYGPYIGTIARNLLVDRARRQGREISLDDLKWDPPCDAESEPAAYTDPATMRVVEAYLARLDPELRAIHQLRYEQARSQADAAFALGISRQQVRTRERKLRKGLLKELRRAQLIQSAPAKSG